MGFVIIYVLEGLMPAVIAKSKGRSFLTWRIYGMLLFIVAIPYALILKLGWKAVDHKIAIKCPYCAETKKRKLRPARPPERALRIDQGLQASRRDS